MSPSHSPFLPLPFDLTLQAAEEYPPDVRIIAGTWRGRPLRAPGGTTTRPTADRVRENLFNILGPPPAAAVLDLCAGSGALGLEALSRGAASAVLVEPAAIAVATIDKNVESLDARSLVRVIRADALTALGRLAQERATFAWVFIDPPYASGLAPRLVEAIGGPHLALLAPDARVIVEHDRRSPPDQTIGALSCDDRRRYGDTELSFYGRTEDRAQGGES